MHKVFLFGSMTLAVIPDVIVQHLQNIITTVNGEVEFIVGDAPGVDTAFQKALASIGAFSKCTIYCVKKARNNVYDFKTRVFDIKFDADARTADIVTPDGEVLYSAEGIDNSDTLLYSRDCYETKDKQMVQDCDFAICYWDGKSKGTLHNIDMLKARDKYVYIYKAIVE